MRRKRLNHAADSLCAIFCGWRLMNSYPEIQALGSGTLKIDALTLACQFDGVSIEPLSIAHELQAWLAADLLKHNIPITALEEAVLCVSMDLQCSPAPTRPRGSFYIGKNGMPIEKGDLFRLTAQCKSSIKTDETFYEAQRDLHEQWPVGWPET